MSVQPCRLGQDGLCCVGPHIQSCLSERLLQDCGALTCKASSMEKECFGKRSLCWAADVHADGSRTSRRGGRQYLLVAGGKIASINTAGCSANPPVAPLRTLALAVWQALALVSRLGECLAVV